MCNDDGTVSVGISGEGEARKQEAQKIVDELNRRHPVEAGQQPKYKTFDGAELPNQSDLAQGPDGAPLPGHCSEAHAAAAAGQNSSKAKSYQTVWVKDKVDCPKGHELPGRPVLKTKGGTEAVLMNPCATCQTNAGEYAKELGKNK